MREPARDKGRLEDILESIRYVKEFTEGINFNTFLADKLRYFAVLKNIEIIGEAAYMISLELKEKHPEIPWGPMIKMRHILVHGYASVLPEILWQTATEDVPLLLTQIETLLSSLESIGKNA